MEQNKQKLQVENHVERQYYKPHYGPEETQDIVNQSFLAHKQK